MAVGPRQRHRGWRLLAIITLAYVGVFGALFLWFDRFSTDAATDRLRTQLRAVALGTVRGIDVEEVRRLYRDGVRNAQGFSDDPRYAHVLDWFETVHQLDPQAWPYLFVRGNRPDTRRAGDEVPEREFIYLADLYARHAPERAVHFLEPDRGSEYGMAAWSTGKLVVRPAVYADKWGRWMTVYAPVKTEAGEVIAVLGVDFDASYVAGVQRKMRTQIGAIFIAAYILLSALALYIQRTRRLRGLFGRYASASLLRDPSLLDLGYASSRRITVLFADINEFSTICERHSPDEVIGMLNDYFDAMNSIIVASGGWIKQFVGDEIMVLYAAPDDHPRPEIAAVETAVTMIERLAERRAAATGPGFFEIKIGIHTGEVIVGNVGNKDRTEYAAVGDHVNLGSRIMGLTKPLGASILISSATRDALGAAPGLTLVDRGSHPVKGRVHEVHVYEVTRG
jgi:class 3 adenylate cyclase